MNELGQHQVNEGAGWTIISTEKVEYRFYEAMGPVYCPVAPVPVIEKMAVETKASDGAAGVRGNAFVVLRGKEFTPNLTVWFGTIACNTVFT